MLCSVCNKRDGTNKYGTQFDVDGVKFQVVNIIIEAVLCPACFAKVSNVFTQKSIETIQNPTPDLSGVSMLKLGEAYTFTFNKLGEEKE